MWAGCDFSVSLLIASLDGAHVEQDVVNFFRWL
jgi:hypothetical protein